MTYQSIRNEIKPPAGVDTILWQNDANTYISTSTIFCLTQSIDNDRIRVGLVKNGTVLSSNSYIAFDSTVYHGINIYLQQIALGPLDSIYVRSENGSSNFIFTAQHKI